MQIPKPSLKPMQYARRFRRIASIPTVNPNDHVLTVQSWLMVLVMQVVVGKKLGMVGRGKGVLSFGQQFPSLVIEGESE